MTFFVDKYYCVLYNFIVKSNKPNRPNKKMKSNRPNKPNKK